VRSSEAGTSLGLAAGESSGIEVGIGASSGSMIPAARYQRLFSVLAAEQKIPRFHDSQLDVAVLAHERGRAGQAGELAAFKEPSAVTRALIVVSCNPSATQRRVSFLTWL